MDKGMMIPMVVTKISKALESGDKLFKNLQGYLIGNPVTAMAMEINSRVEYAYRVALISDELFKNYNYVLSYVWANDPNVQEALNVRKGTITDWKRCNKTLAYDYDVDSVVEYQRNLSTKAYRAFIYKATAKITVVKSKVYGYLILEQLQQKLHLSMHPISNANLKREREIETHQTQICIGNCVGVALKAVIMI